MCRMRGSAVPGIVPLQEEDKRAAGSHAMLRPSMPQCSPMTCISSLIALSFTVTLVYISIVVVAGQSRLNKIPCLVFLSAELHGASTTAYRA